ncbi:TRAP transporter large permease [Entomospira entomophila]|uniref:TRAP transporter large permease n=1 Tax=Entomospira entomophila TaxID=2719988 RepID=A0A968KRG4_9SPIO|nr:TRAP transporter large permease [Entomospira entomophilus]NIZ40723.1 TRAP transporter large permease [Entomospira entomophilus]WDI34936.1 TRAP transporter large permease [Entomospira entomophilus]
MDTGLATLILFGVFFVLLFTGVPIAVGIAIASIATVLTVLPLDMAIFTLTQRLFAGVDSFTLLALPFFILAGQLMNKGGIAIRLVRLAQMIGGRLPGSLYQANVVGNMLFGSISGSTVASAAAIGGILAPMQEKEGYDRSLSAAVNIASAPTGILIPPSGPLILYSLVSGGTSIAALFLAGYIPGLIMGVSIMIVSGFMAYRSGLRGGAPLAWGEKARIIIEAIPALLLIVIVMGGIVGGIFTATEGAAIAVLYSFILAILYKEVKIGDLPKIFGESLRNSSYILFLIATSSMMAYAMTLTNIPSAIVGMVEGVSSNPIIILLMMNVTLVLISTFLDITPAILLFTPIFLPIAQQLNMDPVHFGIMLAFNMTLGNITPPVGTVLFVGCAVGKVTIEEVVPKLLPFFLLLFVLLLVIAYVPSISLFLPRVLGMI